MKASKGAEGSLPAPLTCSWPGESWTLSGYGANEQMLLKNIIFSFSLIASESMD